MTECSVVYTNLSNSEDAGTYLGSEIFKNLAQQSPDVVIVFASSIYDYLALLQAIERACRPRIMVGCSSAGEFINGAQGEGSASAVAIRSTEIQFAAGLGNQLRTDRDKAARQIVSSFTGLNSHNYLYHSALVLTDALAGHADDLVEQLNLLTLVAAQATMRNSAAPMSSLAQMPIPMLLWRWKSCLINRWA
jgi:hypothetical protein